jgi:5-formyltetrahydrofolate cyclo-ligase
LSKDSLRLTALEARKAFVRTLDDAARTLLEEQLAQQLTSLCAAARVVAGYSPMGSEISPLLAIEEARAVGAIVAFRAFDNAGKPVLFLAADQLVRAPFGIMQPKKSAPEVEPDLILVPLIAVDPNGARLGRGKGHYDRVIAKSKRNGAKLIGVGWPTQRLEDTVPADPWDVHLDAFASPAGLEWFDRSGRGH